MDKLLGIETDTTFLLKWREYVIAISAEDEAYYWSSFNSTNTNMSRIYNILFIFQIGKQKKERGRRRLYAALYKLPCMPCRSSTHIYVWITGSRCRLEKVLLNKANNIKMHRFWLEVWKCSQLFLWFASTKLYRQRPFPIAYEVRWIFPQLVKTRKSIGPTKKLLIGSDKLLTQKCNSLDDSKCRLLCSLWKLVVWLLMNIAEWFI